jgi:23S rRNA (cytosine1962-C5)-methyltransferase
MQNPESKICPSKLFSLLFLSPKLPPRLQPSPRPPVPEKTPRLRLRITAAAENYIRAGHPWVYGDSVHEANRPGTVGELAVIYDRQDKFLAIGFYDPDSPIRVRVLQVGKSQPLDAAWWQARLLSALQRREGWFEECTNGGRLINGESDGWPGLVLDQYGRTLVLKIYTAAWLPLLGLVANLIQTRLQPERIVLRLSRNIIEASARFAEPRRDGDILFGPPLSGPVVFRENGLHFEAEVLQGQKTGFFLDQRENRREVGLLARGLDVLNAFSFSGGFSLYAARGGARSVTDLDISAHALASAERNFKLNHTDPAVSQCRHECIQTDAFAWVAGNDGRQFGLIILDPPSLAKRECERLGAIEAYARLVANSIRRLTRPGWLVACSCSAHVTATEFFNAVRLAARRSNRRWEELKTTGHAADHPASFKEAEYLKAIYLKFG